MLKTKQDFLNKIHLIISLIIVVPVALLYGFNPSLEFDIHLDTIDELNAFKAIMGLYLGFSTLWVLGILQNKYLKLALVTNMIFMLGLGLGRLLSLALDGTPTFAYIFGTVGELVLGIYGIVILSRLK
ncbi:DUF4345 domain-containing protein [Hyunsoonleella flava]|uniref:DUF4345 domain-containing protein n=1 Tax=Hyunsoonleella flava TaxID=2527939 RepID=A0A4Q9FH43_9FLAO|nr:DUF4345 domain-containing protein [Hyunsoonleella flava]TBN03981.1 DUF4345 domain-containing protein [Hyunsoonleella flava]